MNSKPKRLLMFDYDGVVVKPQEDSFSILRESMLNVLQRNLAIKPEDFDNLDWPKIFSVTKGTTERFYMNNVLNSFKVPSQEHNRLFQEFIAERSQLIQQYNKDRGLKKFDDLHVFADFLKLKDKIQADSSHETLFFLVTGNPGFVMKDRLPEEINKLFHYWIGGDLGKTRADLIHIALQEAREQFGFQGLVDDSGSYVNAFYLDDAPRAIISAQREKVRCILIPREIPKELNEIMKGKTGFEVSSWEVESLRNFILFSEFEEKFGPTTTRQILMGDAERRTTQRVMTVETLDDMFLFDDLENPHKYRGWLDPEMHMWGRIRYKETGDKYQHQEGYVPGKKAAVESFMQAYGLYNSLVESHQKRGKERY